MIPKIIVLSSFLVPFLSCSEPVAPGTRLWNIAVQTEELVYTIDSKIDVVQSTLDTIEEIDISILSQVGIINSKIENINISISDLIIPKLNTIESYVEVIDARTVTIESTIDVIDLRTITLESTLDALDLFVTGTVDSKLDLIQETDLTILSVVDGIAACCSSNSDAIISDLDIIIQKLNTTESLVEVIDERTVTIKSTIDVIDLRTIALESTLDTLDLFVTGTVDSKLDLIQETDLTILSVVDGIAACCASNSDAIISDLDVIIQKLNTTESLVEVIDQRTITIESTVDIIESIDRTIESFVEVIDPRTITIESVLDTLDLFVTGTVDSKLDLIQETDLTILSVVDGIAACCSSNSDAIISDLDIIIQKLNTTESLVEVIDQRTITIESTVDIIESIDRTIESFVEAIDPRTITIESVLDTLDLFVTGTVDSKLDLIQETDLTILSVVDGIAACCASNSDAIISDLDVIIQKLNTTESLVEVIDQRTITIESTVDIIESIDRTIESFVEVIDPRTITIESVLDTLDLFVTGTINSKLDVIEKTDLTILSQVEVINSKLDNLDISISDLDIIIQKLDTIESYVEVIDHRTITLESTVDVIDLRTITIESKLNALDLFVTDTVNSKLDLIQKTDLTILSVVDGIAACCSSNSDVIISDLDVIIQKLNTTESLVEVIDQRTITIESTIDVIDLRTITIESMLDSLDLFVTGTVDSKLDLIQETDLTILSKVNIIDMNLNALTASELDRFVATFTLLVILADDLLSTMEEIASVSDVISHNLSTLDQMLTSITDVILTVDSKVTVIDSKIDIIEAIDLTILSQVDITESLVEVIDHRTITIESTLDALDLFVTGTVNSKLDLIESTDLTILSVVDGIAACCASNSDAIISDLDVIIQKLNTTESLVEVIDHRTITIESTLDALDSFVTGTVNSKLDLIESTDLTILSVVDGIAACCASNSDAIISDLDVIIQKLNTTESLVEVIDRRTVTIESTLDALDLFVTGTVNSKLDLIESTDLTILSVVDGIAACCASNSDAIISDLDVIIQKLNTTESLVEVIDRRTVTIESTLDTLDSFVTGTVNSKLDLIESTDLTILSVVDGIAACCASNSDAIISDLDVIIKQLDTIESYVEVIDHRTITIESVLDSLDLFVTGTINSKLDVINSNVNLTESLASVIDTRTSSIYSLDQIINSEVNVIDTRTSSIYSLDQIIASNVSNIYALDQVINSKVDVSINLDNTILSSLSSITTSTSTQQAFVSIYGSEIAEGRVDNISVQFQYGIPPTVISYTQNGGAVTTSNSMAVLTTSGTAGAIAQIQTQNNIIYRSGHEADALFTVAFTGSFAATSSQFIGPIDYQNGFAVGFNGATFGVTQRSNTVNTFIPQSSFNQDTLNGAGPSGFTYNPTKLNVFRIAYGYLGASIIKFQIMNTNGNWITFHTIQYPNTASVPSIQQPFLPITARAEDLSGGNSISMQTASWNGGIIGSPSNVSYRYYQTNNTVTNPSTTAETHVLTIRNRNTFNSKRNVIEVRCAAFGGGALDAANESTTVRLRKNATVTGTSYSNIDTNNSVIAVSTAGTFTAGTGLLELIRPAQSQGNGPTIDFIPQGVYEIIIYPGETLTITAQSNSGTQTVLCGIAWEERF